MYNNLFVKNTYEPEKYKQIISDLKNICRSTYNAKLENWIANILKDHRLKKIITTELDKQIFETYLWSIKNLPANFTTGQIIDYIGQYLEVT